MNAIFYAKRRCNHCELKDVIWSIWINCNFGVNLFIEETGYVTWIPIHWSGFEWKTWISDLLSFSCFIFEFVLPGFGFSWRVL